MTTRTFWTAALFAAAASVSVAGPNTIAYQGGLLYNNGIPAADGNYKMRFAVFSVSSGGAGLWTQDVTSVTVKTGLFSVTLGGAPAPFGTLFANNSDLWLQVSADLNRNHVFDANETYLPRQ